MSISATALPFAASLGIRLKLLVAVLLCLGAVLAGCAPVQGPGPETRDDAPQALWQRFRSGAEANGTSPAFSLTSSLNYSGPQQQTRIVIHFWGNADYPLRMDLQAGIGAIFSYWREDAQGFTAYVPEEKAAYLHEDGRLGMAAFGFSFPFSLRELALFLTGRVNELLPQDYETALVLPDKGVEFGFMEAGRRFTLVLDPDGRPREMTSPDIPPWRLEVRAYMDEPGLEFVPSRIRITRDPEETILLTLKSFELRQEPWGGANLALDLPPGTELRRLLNQ